MPLKRAYLLALPLFLVSSFAIAEGFDPNSAEGYNDTQGSHAGPGNGLATLSAPAGKVVDGWVSKQEATYQPSGPLQTADDIVDFETRKAIVDPSHATALRGELDPSETNPAGVVGWDEKTNEAARLGLAGQNASLASTGALYARAQDYLDKYQATGNATYLEVSNKLRDRADTMQQQANAWDTARNFNAAETKVLTGDYGDDTAAPLQTGSATAEPNTGSLSGKSGTAPGTALTDPGSSGASGGTALATRGPSDATAQASQQSNNSGPNRTTTPDPVPGAAARGALGARPDGSAPLGTGAVPANASAPEFGVTQLAQMATMEMRAQRILKQSPTSLDLQGVRALLSVTRRGVSTDALEANENLKLQGVQAITHGRTIFQMSGSGFHQFQTMRRALGLQQRSPTINSALALTSP